MTHVDSLVCKQKALQVRVFFYLQYSGIITVKAVKIRLIMAREDTQFSSTNQPKKRGKAQRTLLLEALKDAGKDEKGFYSEMVTRAMNPDDPASAQLMKEVFSRIYPAAKPTMPIVEFNFPFNGSAVEKVSALENAISSGLIPADVAKLMTDIIKASVEIEKITDLMERIDAIEKALNDKPE